jgi:spermidine/putrescine transport system ATP-binding protein
VEQAQRLAASGFPVRVLEGASELLRRLHDEGVALARALVNHPRALLLDEPLAALDLKLRQAMQIELKRIQREVGITFIFVTHDQGEALTLSDRLVVMNEGVVEQLGTPHEIYERPATKFVAGFIGTSNVLSGAVQRVNGGVAVLVPGEGEQILLPGNGLAPGQTVELTVRPEKVVVHTADDCPVGDRSLIRGTVTDVTYLGTSTTYTVRRDEETELVVFQQNASSPQASARVGDSVWLSWLPEHSYVFTSTAQSTLDAATATT